MFSVTVHLGTSFNLNMMEQDNLATAVATLPTSLRELTLIVNDVQLGSDELKKEVLSTIQRCGQTLTRLEVDTGLSNVTIQRVMRLPNLHTLRASRSLLSTTLPPSSESAYSPVLRSLALTVANPCDWVIFLADPHPIANGVRSTLSELKLRGHQIASPTLISKICFFRNLTRLDGWWFCHSYKCDFALTDEDLSRLSLGLPRLERLMLGHQ